MKTTQASLLDSFRARFATAWRRSDDLFALVPHTAYLAQPIDLRHPVLFYIGHLPAFAWNQIGRGALGLGSVNPRFDALFARGIDPADTDSAKTQHITNWPSIDETLAYRDVVRADILRCIPRVLERTDDVLCEHGRVLHMVLEHEWMHHETLLYMLAESPPGLIVRPDCVERPLGGPGKAAEPRRIEAGEAILGAKWTEIPFGWDNEFSQVTLEVPAFTIDSLPVRNSDWLRFFEDRNGQESLWPQSWARDSSGQLAVKTLFGLLPFEEGAGFPVQVSGNQARTYCEQHGGRLPTEPELHRAAYHAPDGSVRDYPWGHETPSAEHGNFGFRRF